MNQREQDAFYVGAALFLNLDSDEVDAALAQYELSVKWDTVEACRTVLKKMFPKRYEAGRRYRRALDNPNLQ